MDLDIKIKNALARIPAPRALQGSDLGRLVEVRMHMRPKSPGCCHDEQTSLMLEDQLLAFITATLELHFAPGVNPHTGGKTHPVWEIVLAKFGEPRSYWHTTPGLHAGLRGAAVLDWNEGHIVPVWRHPDCNRYWEGTHVNDDRIECDLPALNHCGTCFGLKAAGGEPHLTREARCICPAADPVAADQPG